LNNTTLYELPNASDSSFVELLFGYPNKITGGFFGAEIILLIFATTFLSSLAFQRSARVSFLLGSFTSWITSLILVGMGTMLGTSIVGSEVLTVTSVVLIVALIGNYIGGR